MGKTSARRLHTYEDSAAGYHRTIPAQVGNQGLSDLREKGQAIT
jgi:hypothetical protein